MKIFLLQILWSGRRQRRGGETLIQPVHHEGRVQLREASLRWLRLSALTSPQWTYHYGSFFKNELWGLNHSWNMFKITLGTFTTSTAKLLMSKSISCAFVPPSEQKPAEMLLWEGRQTLVSSGMLIGSEECIDGSLGYCLCPSLLGCQFQTLEGLQMNVTWQTRATKSSSASQGKK